MSWIKKHRRIFFAYGCCLLIMLVGILVMEFNNGVFEATGSGIMLLSGGIFFYISLFWVVLQLIFKRPLQRLQKAETWLLALAVSFICFMVTVESVPNYPIATFFFAELLVFIPLFRYQTGRLPLSANQAEINQAWGAKQFLFWSVAIGLAVMIMVMAIYELEPLVNLLAAAYFFIAFGLSVRWIIRQIRSLINLKKEKAQTELLHLKSQVNPHFFFNMLNNLYGVVEHEPQQAKPLILKLSDMMRYGIYEGQKNFVPLQQEVDYLQNFIELHKMRYHKIIDVQFRHDIQNGEQNVMPLLFIILLENAFKHGIENLRDNAWIRVEMKTDDTTIHFSVANNFDPSLPAAVPGIGLKNLRRRLELAYPGRHNYTFTKEQDQYSAHLSLRYA
ncbi:MAG: histidine kinase [Bacteroidota bacterium]